MAIVNASEPKTTMAFVKKVAFSIVYYGYIPFICYKGKEFNWPHCFNIKIGLRTVDWSLLMASIDQAKQS